MVEPIEAFEPGTIERRKHRRLDAPVKAYFKEVSAEVLKEFQEGKAAAGPRQDQEGWEAEGKGSALTGNLSPGGLLLVGGLELMGSRAILPGTCLEVELEISQIAPVKVICQVIWSRMPEDGQGKFAAGLKFLAVGKKDLERLERFLQARAAGDEAL